MAAKRRGAKLLFQVKSKIAKTENEESENEEMHLNEVAKWQTELEEKNNVTKEEHFKNVLDNTSAEDRLFEYQVFLKRLPMMHHQVCEELKTKVKKELKIEENKDFYSLKTNNPDNLTPLLDALGCKLGMNLSEIICPPTLSCLLCGKLLTKNNEPTQVSLLDLQGPMLATKYIWRCRNCKQHSKIATKTNSQEKLIKIMFLKLVFFFLNYHNILLTQNSIFVSFF